MPAVEDVLFHWIEAYSNDKVDPYSEDFLFFFGWEKKRDIVVTTCLSAVTVGVDLDNRFVGTAGTRILRYVYFPTPSKWEYKVVPPSNDWNCERIPRCVSVAVRLTVFYANAWSLNTVYVFQQPGLAPKIRLDRQKLVVFERKSGKALHVLNVQGDRDELRKHWADIEKEAIAEGARAGKLRQRDVDLIKIRPSAFGPMRVDPKSRKLVRIRREKLNSVDGLVGVPQRIR